jgi:putative hydrolase of the HAD superfamily
MNRLEDIILKNCPPLAPLPTDIEAELNKLEGIRAVLFDIYGTLFVSGSGDVGTAAATDTAEALTQALRASGFEGDLKNAGTNGKAMIKEEILELHEAARDAGVDSPEVEIRYIWQRIIDSLNLDGTGDVEQLAVEYECRVNPVYPMPGCIDTLQAIKAKQLTLGIVSNAQFYTPLLFSAFFDQTVAELGFDPDCCIWSFKELKAKPSADLFPKAAKFLEKNHGVNLSETVYVGNDMLNDIYTAKQAGCKTILFAGDKRSLRLRENDERCKDLKPDAVITSLDQLKGII